MMRVRAWRREKGAIREAVKVSLPVRMLAAAHARGVMRSHYSGALHQWRSTVADQLVGWVALALLWRRPGVFGRLIDWTRLLVGKDGRQVCERTVRRAIEEAREAGWLRVRHHFAELGGGLHAQRPSLLEPGPELCRALIDLVPPAVGVGVHPSESGSLFRDLSPHSPKVDTPPGGGNRGVGSGGGAASRAAAAAGAAPASSWSDRRAQGADGPVDVAELLAWSRQQAQRLADIGGALLHPPPARAGQCSTRAGGAAAGDDAGKEGGRSCC